MTIWGDASRLQHSWFRIELLLDPIPLVPNDGVFGKCSQKLAPGMRYLTCCLIHVDLKAALSLLAQDRSSLDKQLCKTTMPHTNTKHPWIIFMGQLHLHLSVVGAASQQRLAL